jgi:hypothetical protein
VRRSEYLESDRGRRLLYLSRWFRRTVLTVEGIEPRGKKRTGPDDALAIQLQLLRGLLQRKRRAFRGPLVLALDFRTTDRTPAHIHTLAKNILDLLGKPLPGLKSRREGLLYFDDSQIQGLIVRCEHGADTPSISIDARSISDLREDLALGTYARERLSDYVVADDDDRDRDSDVGDLIGDREVLVSMIGEDAFRSLEIMARRDTQRRLLESPRLRIDDLAYLYRARASGGYKPSREMLDHFADSREILFKRNPFRLVLRELPTSSGGRKEFKAHVAKAVRGFQDRFGRLLAPLLNPVALEVIVKPPRAASESVLHDLDNVVRDYLIPEITTLSPPSHIAHATYRGTRDVPSQVWSDRLKKLPKSAAVGVVRYEVWRIPRSAGDSTSGFVSVAVVADDFGRLDSLSRLDRMTDKWSDSID